MIQNKKHLNLFISALLFVGLKFIYSTLDNTQLLWLLHPTKRLVELFTGSSAVFELERGYFFGQLNMVIDKSCSGFNFWLLCFLLLVYLVLDQRPQLKGWWLVIPGALLTAYFLTIFVNSSRILLVLIINKLEVFSHHFPWLHEAEGVFVYLFFLTFIYLVFQYLLTTKTHKI